MSGPVKYPLPSIRIAEVVSALSQALDLGSESTALHSVRTCILAMRIAAELKAAEDVQDELYYASLLKDVGHRGNTSQTRVVTVSAYERGATLSRLMRLPEPTALGIASVNEHWSGRGSPRGLKGEQIPVSSRITLLAQALDSSLISLGPEGAISAVTQRAGRWFDPNVVKAARSLARRGELWADLALADLPRFALQLELNWRTFSGGQANLDAICQAFATIVDAKSPFTYNHSNGVANVAVAMAKKLELDSSRILLIRHAALLHDLGKMAIPNVILLKRGKLDAAEWRSIRSHPKHTWRILRSISGFEEMSEVAAAHHERLDGSGYFRGFTGRQLSLEARILAVADVFDALSESRPYRTAMPAGQALSTIRKGSPHRFDATCLEALEQSNKGFDSDVQPPLSDKGDIADAARRFQAPLCHQMCFEGV